MTRSSRSRPQRGGSFQSSGSPSGSLFVRCPRTYRALRLPPIDLLLCAAWVTESGTGYAQQNFQIEAPGGRCFGHEQLGVAKFAEDVFHLKQDSDAFLA